MINNNKLFIIIVLLLTTSCRQSLSVYNNIAVIDGQIFPINDTISISSHYIFNGSYTLNVNDSIYKQGNYDNSISIGKWQYMISSDTPVVINWLRQDDIWDNVKLSVPDYWAKINNIDEPVAIFYDLINNIDREYIVSDYFSVLIHQDVNNDTLENYNNLYQKRVENESVLYADHFIISINHKKIYYNRFVVDRNGSIILLLNINAKIDDTIIDITLNKKDYNLRTCQIEFLEVLRTIRINNNWMLPYKGFLEIKPATQLHS